MDDLEEVEIEARSLADGTARRTTIWVVVDDNEVYVRSLRGNAGRWYQKLQGSPVTVLYAGDRRIPLRAVLADDPQTISRVTDAYHRKYGQSPYLDGVLHDGALRTTTRLEPA